MTPSRRLLALARWRRPSGAGEDRNLRHETTAKTASDEVAPALRGRRGSQHGGQAVERRDEADVAPALRGRRGSQLQIRGHVGPAVCRWRRPQHVHQRLRLLSAARGAGLPRPARIATGRWTNWSPSSSAWRRPSGAGEDRNRWQSMSRGNPEEVAPALRGWRGLQLDRARQPGAATHRVAPAFRGWRGSQPVRPAGGGRASTPWRRPSGGGEDRNDVVADIRADRHRMAPALRGRRGSQQPSRREQERAAARVAPALWVRRGSQPGDSGLVGRCGRRRGGRPAGSGVRGRRRRGSGRRRAFWVVAQLGADGLGEAEEGDVAVPAGQAGASKWSRPRPVMSSR